MSSVEDLRILDRRGRIGIHAHREVNSTLRDRNRGDAVVQTEVGAQIKIVVAGLSESPAEMGVGVDGKGGCVLPFLETVLGIEVVLHLAEGAGEVGGQASGAAHTGSQNVHTRGASGAHGGAITLHAQAKPHRVERDVFDERNHFGGVFDSILGKGNVRDTVAQVGVKALDEVLLLEHKVVGESNVRVDDIADVAQARLVGVWVGAFRHQ